jgi:hypothetical protein
METVIKEIHIEGKTEIEVLSNIIRGLFNELKDIIDEYNAERRRNMEIWEKERIHLRQAINHLQGQLILAENERTALHHRMNHQIIDLTLIQMENKNLKERYASN